MAMYRSVFLLMLLLIAACAKDDPEADKPEHQANDDAAASNPSDGGGVEAGYDAGNDGGVDAGGDADDDGGVEAGYDANTGGDANTESGVDGGLDAAANCTLVTLTYRAELVTIAGTPFGLQSNVDRGRFATGSLTYDTCVGDGSELPNLGEFDHVSRETGAFSFELDAPSAGQTVSLRVAGSTRPMVRIRALDYFDFDDGGYDLFEDVDRYLKIDGAVDEEAEVHFTIGAGSEDFADYSLPEVFPYSGESESDFACVNPEDYCVTFSISESTHGDSFLMVLHSLQ
jgi:hypothetical protein